MDKYADKPALLKYLGFRWHVRYGQHQNVTHLSNADASATEQPLVPLLKRASMTQAAPALINRHVKEYCCHTKQSPPHVKQGKSPCPHPKPHDLLVPPSPLQEIYHVDDVQQVWALVAGQDP